MKRGVLHTAPSQFDSHGGYVSSKTRDRFDLRRKEELAEAAVEERDADLGRKGSVTQFIITLWKSCKMYTEDQDAADNGVVLRVGGLIVDGAQEALLRTGGVGDDNALGGHCYRWERRCRWIEGRDMFDVGGVGSEVEKSAAADRLASLRLWCATWTVTLLRRALHMGMRQ